MTTTIEGLRESLRDAQAKSLEKKLAEYRAFVEMEARGEELDGKQQQTLGRLMLDHDWSFEVFESDATVMREYIANEKLEETREAKMAALDAERLEKAARVKQLEAELRELRTEIGGQSVCGGSPHARGRINAEHETLNAQGNEFRLLVRCNPRLFGEDVVTAVAHKSRGLRINEVTREMALQGPLMAVRAGTWIQSPALR